MIQGKNNRNYCNKEKEISIQKNESDLISLSEKTTISSRLNEEKDEIEEIINKYGIQKVKEILKNNKYEIKRELNKKLKSYIYMKGKEYLKDYIFNKIKMSKNDNLIQPNML